MSLTALKKLVESSKATVLVSVIILIGVLVATGTLSPEQFEATLKWLVGTWFLAHAGEQSAKALADAKTPRSNLLMKGITDAKD